MTTPDPVRTSHEVRLVRRPAGMPVPEDFEVARRELPEPGDGEVTVRNLWLSVDPYMRNRMNDVKSYSPPYALGEPMLGGAVGRVVRSRSDALAEGDLVLSNYGWREGFVSGPDGLERVEPELGPPSAFLGALGMPGLTAWVGLHDLAAPSAGETLYVSAASGAVGSLVGQLGRIAGMRVVGSAGGPVKTAVLLHELGFDAAIDHRADDLTGQLEQACPDGLDVYFDNVGGDSLRAAIAVANDHARFVECGMISQYNGPTGTVDNLSSIVRKRLTLRGFIVWDHRDRADIARREISSHLRDGRLVVKETVRDGIESAVPAFLGLLTGDNVGKMLVHLPE